VQIGRNIKKKKLEGGRGQRLSETAPKFKVFFKNFSKQHNKKVNKGSRV